MYDMIHNSCGAGYVLVNKGVTVYRNTFFSIISILAINSLSLDTHFFTFTHTAIIDTCGMMLYFHLIQTDIIIFNFSC